MRFFTTAFLFSLVFFKCNAQLSPKNIAESKAVIRVAEKTVKKYHAGSTLTDNIIKVVYFYANDRQPLRKWNERLSRTLAAVSDFYKEEFARYGVKIDGVNFERGGKKYLITLVKGDLDSKSYGVNSGPQLQAEISRKVGGKIDFTKDFVLIMTGLTDTREDGTYVVHSPYMAMGSSERGVCFAADCELLDPKLLSDTTTRMKFSEQMVSLKECSVAEFNSWYIGGIAHEMGHLFGLRHDFGNPAELNSTDISLMGQYGSRHFKGYLWGDSQTSHFSAAGILQLLSHPIFTRSRKNINNHVNLDLADFKVEINNKNVMLNTDISADEPPYALSVLWHPMTVLDYFSQSTVYGIAATGALRIPLGQCAEGSYVITFIFMFPNGTSQAFNKIFTVNHDGGGSVADFPIRGTVNIQAFYDRLLKKTQTPEIQQKLKF